MRRCVLTSVAALLVFAVPAVAEGKVMVKEAEVCSAEGCATQTGTRGEPLAFELFGPVIQSGRQTPAPAVAEEPLRVELTTFPAPFPTDRLIELELYPEAGYIHVLGEPGAEAGGAALNVGWVRLEPQELAAYENLTSELGSIATAAPADSDDGAPPWGLIGGIVAAIGLAALAVGAVRRRRTPDLVPEP